MLAAVESNGTALAHAANEMQDDADVVTAAVRSAPSALQFASERLRGSAAFMLQLIELDGSVLEFAPAETRRNKAAVLSAVAKNGELLAFADCALKADVEVSKLVALDSGTLQIARVLLAVHRVQALAAVYVCVRAYTCHVRAVHGCEAAVFEACGVGGVPWLSSDG